QAKYAGYIERQRSEVARAKHQESMRIPKQFDYQRVTGLSSEVREKLICVAPTTLGQAARIPGVTPAAISLLAVYLKKRHSNDLRSA
ncbi:MAG TPA: tRNA uridine-5-carboxymethylaminomethyl(34) synthesis enzyme MnmG, partial [Gammaproteobacteria bacterium]|nr:tRNA uridine-5-carboxymethylaminomethyl(34) synthesis enzyme MnmG [Gammaproteobacteria bacterium]